MTDDPKDRPVEEEDSGDEQDFTLSNSNSCVGNGATTIPMFGGRRLNSPSWRITRPQTDPSLFQKLQFSTGVVCGLFPGATS